MARHLSPRPGRRTRTLLAVSLLLVLVSAAGLGVALTRPAPSGGAAPGTSEPTRRSGTPEPPRREVRPSTDWVQVLARLDRRRSRAFATGDPALLARVYLDGSAPLRMDRRLLRRYADRGLRVTGLRMRVVDVRLLAGGETSAVLRVRDRVSGGLVEGDDGNSRPLRGDAWSRHRVRLERGRDGWRIAKLELVG